MWWIIIPSLQKVLLVQFSSIAQLWPTFCNPMDCSTPGFPFHHQLQSLLKLGPLIWWCHPTISSSVIPFSSWPQSFPASGSFPMSQLFTSGFSFNISPYTEHSGLISFRVDWLDLLAVQGTLRSLLQHHSSKALILWHSTFFIVLLSHPCMTTGKTIALTRKTFLGKVMPLLFNMHIKKFSNSS